ncbi:MAG: hypothetical protein KA053_10865 [Lentimicrobiaceae bacterium]|nr:hypothetical protein [Lentimicrobiaceae bacterium]
MQTFLRFSFRKPPLPEKVLATDMQEKQCERESESEFFLHPYPYPYPTCL